jgi:hypothetical protein
MAETWDCRPLPILLVPEAWTQNIRSRGGASLTVRSKLSGGFRFLLPGGGDLLGVSFDLTLVRGDHDWEIKGPTDWMHRLPKLLQARTGY